MFNFGERLREMRLQRGISQTEMARRLNVNRRTYVRYESEESFPALHHLMEIVDILSLSLDQIFNIPMTDVTEREKQLIDIFRKIPVSEQEEAIKAFEAITQALFVRT